VEQSLKSQLAQSRSEALRYKDEIDGTKGQLVQLAQLVTENVNRAREREDELISDMALARDELANFRRSIYEALSASDKGGGSAAVVNSDEEGKERGRKKDSEVAAGQEVVRAHKRKASRDEIRKDAGSDECRDGKAHVAKKKVLSDRKPSVTCPSCSKPQQFLSWHVKCCRECSRKRSIERTYVRTNYKRCFFCPAWVVRSEMEAKICKRCFDSSNSIES
jgi:hypothetical protein